MGVASSTVRLRLLGGAIGSLISAVAALLGAVTIVLGIIGAVGIPVGAVIGMALAPKLVAAPSVHRLVMTASLLAVPLGVGGFALIGVLGEGRGASPSDLIEVGLMYSIIYGTYGVILGWPMALVVAAVAARVLRRLAPRADRLWVPALLVVGFVGVVTAGILVAALANPSDEAAQLGGRVRFEHRVDNMSDREFTLDVRSYWKGEAVGGSSEGIYGTGECVSSGWASDALQESDWAIWLGPPNSDWEDRPAGEPLVTSADYGEAGTVRLTIVIEPDGAARVVEGSAAGCER